MLGEEREHRSSASPNQMVYSARGNGHLGGLGDSEALVSSSDGLGTSPNFWGGTCHDRRRALGIGRELVSVGLGGTQGGMRVVWAC
jgi:hypothetical protein